MDVFHDYAGYYDDLYEDKDYLKECIFIKNVLEKYSDQSVKSLLDLGCGTGSHALHFAEMGYDVTGVDLSEEMLNIARQKNNININFIRQDIKNLNLEQKYDAAVAMFAVMGYQTTNENFEKALKSVHKHLNKGGLLIFDVWFGPTVLTNKPEKRMKIMEVGRKKVIRCAIPDLDISQQTVTVKYHILEILEKTILKEFEESHIMRFFFYQELIYFLNKSGFSIINICPFMRYNDDLDDNCWNINVVCKAFK